MQEEANKKLIQKRTPPAEVENIYNKIAQNFRNTCSRSIIAMIINSTTDDFKLIKVDNIHGEYGKMSDKLGYVGSSPDILKAG